MINSPPLFWLITMYLGFQARVLALLTCLCTQFVTRESFLCSGFVLLYTEHTMLPLFFILILTQTHPNCCQRIISWNDYCLYNTGCDIIEQLIVIFYLPSFSSPSLSREIYPQRRWDLCSAASTGQPQKEAFPYYQQPLQLCVSFVELRIMPLV